MPRQEALSSERLRAVLAATGMTVWITDPQGNGVHATDWLERTAQPEQALFDSSWSAAIHTDDRERIASAWSAALEQQTLYEAQYRVLVKGAGYRWFRSHAVPVRDEAGNIVEWVGTSQEVDRLVRRDEGMRFLTRASAALSESLEERATLDTLARLSVESLADGCMITLARADGTFDHVTTRSTDDNATAAFAAETERMYPLAADAPSGYPRAIRTGEAELIPEGAFHDDVLPTVAADDTHLERLRQLRMYSGMVVPLVARSGHIGAITFVLFGDRTRRAFDEADLALATDLARRASLAVDNARLFAAERAARASAAHAADRVQAMADASRAFGENATDPRLLMDALCRIVTQRVGDMCVVRLLSSDATTLDPVAAYHLEPEVNEQFRTATFEEVVPMSSGLSARMVRDGTPLLVAHANPDEIAARATGRHREFLERHPFHSVAGVPLRAEGRILGTVLLARESPGRPYTHDDVALVQDLADRASLVLERARLFTAERRARAEAERAADLTRRLQEITASFARTITLEEVANVTLSHGLDVLGASSGGVYRMHPDGAYLELVMQRGVDVLSSRYVKIGLDEALPLAECVREGTILFLDGDADPRTRYSAAATDEGIASSWITMPLMHDERVLGAVGLGYAEHEGTLSPEQRALADALARHCAQAMERARLLDAARLARDAAERANQAKSDLLAKVSHETRQPVHATVGWAEMLELEIHGPVTPAQRDALRRIKGNQSRLLIVLNDLLDIARIQAGKLDLSLREIVVADIVDGVESAIAPQMRDKGINYDFCRPESSMRVFADLDQVVGIMTNLLGNAAKFTSNGGRVDVRCEDDGDRVHLIVRDTGIGIAPELVDRVFEPFFQVEGGFTRTTAGTGLGLAISRESARAMGGDVTVESVLGEGSVFTVVLPRGP